MGTDRLVLIRGSKELSLLTGQAVKLLQSYVHCNRQYVT